MLVSFALLKGFARSQTVHTSVVKARLLLLLLLLLLSTS